MFEIFLSFVKNGFDTGTNIDKASWKDESRIKNWHHSSVNFYNSDFVKHAKGCLARI
jgi:hypothetical protein